MSRNATLVYRPPIDRPRVLLVVSHPAVGGGIETLLRLEKRYEVRRVTKLSDALAVTRAWPADVALVDAAMLGGDARLPLGVPALVLATSVTESDAARRALDDQRGWVAKDAPARDLIAAVERLLTRPTEAVAGTLSLLALGALLAVFVAMLGYLVWIAVV
jgi:DNA-binding NarL/FixJ family response regulator